MESIQALLLALALVPYQLSRGKQGCGEGSRLREMNGCKGGELGSAVKIHGFERLGCTALVGLSSRPRNLSPWVSTRGQGWNLGPSCPNTTLMLLLLRAVLPGEPP